MEEITIMQLTELPEEEFAFDEMVAMSQKIDTILNDLEKLKLGQEIIWTDVMDELNELKAYYGLGKKNWRQLFRGKILEMIISGVISDTVSTRIVDAINPVINELR